MSSSSLSTLSSLSELSDTDSDPSAPTTSKRRKSTVKPNPRVKPFEAYEESEFKLLFRLSKATVLYLLKLFGGKIVAVAKRHGVLEPMDQMLIALRYFATGSYRKVVEDVFQVSQATMNRIVHRVATEIADLKTMFINMPSKREQLEDADEFFKIAGMPHVIGALGASHIRIAATSSTKDTYLNQDGYYSLNMQCMCTATLKIRDVTARPGSLDDYATFYDSPLRAQLECGDNVRGEMLLLGDSAYPCCSYLLTPLLSPPSPGAEAYNKAHSTTLSAVKKLFVLLKHRFPCLEVGMAMKVQNVPAVVIACAVLHNVALAQNDLMDETEGAAEPGVEVVKTATCPVSDENVNIRTYIINTNFQ